MVEFYTFDLTLSLPASGFSSWWPGIISGSVLGVSPESIPSSIGLISQDTVVWFVKVATAFIAGVSLIYKGWTAFKSKKTPVEETRATSEITLLQSLMEQSQSDRQRAEKAELERNEAIRQIGRLEGEIAGLSHELQAVKLQQETNIRLLRQQNQAIARLQRLLIKSGGFTLDALIIGTDDVNDSTGG